MLLKNGVSNWCDMKAKQKLWLRNTGGWLSSNTFMQEQQPRRKVFMYDILLNTVLCYLVLSNIAEKLNEPPMKWWSTQIWNKRTLNVVNVEEEALVSAENINNIAEDLHNIRNSVGLEGVDSLLKNVWKWSTSEGNLNTFIYVHTSKFH